MSVAGGAVVSGEFGVGCLKVCDMEVTGNVTEVYPIGYLK